MARYTPATTNTPAQKAAFAARAKAAAGGGKSKSSGTAIPHPTVPGGYTAWGHPVSLIFGNGLAPGAKSSAKPGSASKSTPGKPGTPAKTTTTRTPVAPFLTAGQANTRTQYETNYQYNIGALNDKLANATVTTNANLAAAQKTHDINTNNANQSTAARGLFQSSIRAGDLNDIDAALAMRDNLLNTSLHNLQIATQTNEARLQSNWIAQENLYNQQMVTNAQNQTPSAAVTTTTPGTPGTPGTQTPAQQAAALSHWPTQPAGSPPIPNPAPNWGNLPGAWGSNKPPVWGQMPAAQHTAAQQVASGQSSTGMTGGAGLPSTKAPPMNPKNPNPTGSGKGSGTYSGSG